MKTFSAKAILVIASLFPFFMNAQAWYSHEFGIDLFPAFQIGEGFGQATYSMELIYKKPIFFGKAALRTKLSFDNRRPVFPDGIVFRRNSTLLPDGTTLFYSNKYQARINVSAYIGVETTLKRWGPWSMTAAADIFVKKISAKLDAENRSRKLDNGTEFITYSNRLIPIQDEEYGILFSLGIERTFFNHWNIRIELGPQFTQYVYAIPLVDINGNVTINEGVQEQMQFNLINDIAITYRF